jgi:hypothetical protein
VRLEVITQRDDLLIRRMVLEPGEAMPWHTDKCQRFTVVLRGEQLRIEFRDNGEVVTVPVHSGLAEWDRPEGRIHRGVNAGGEPYEEIVLFFLEPARIDPQPRAP